MRNKLRELFVICEGQTEELFLEHLRNFFETKYNIKIVNAKSGDRILNEYKKIKKNNTERKIFVMYDMDKYNSVDEIIKLYKKYSYPLKVNDSLFFINPKFELVFELCKGPKKSDEFEKFIKDKYDVDNYKKDESQIKKILKQINQDNIKELIKNLKKESPDSKVKYSTNYDILFNNLYVFPF